MEMIDKKINEELNKELEANESKRFIKSQRALFGDPSGKIRTFAIISPDNPVGIFGQEEWSKISQLERTSFNKENRKELQQLLSRAEAIKRDGNKAMGYGGFDYVKIKGSYGDKETSYLIFNLTLEDAKIVAKNYGQESFFYGKVSKTPSTNPSQIAYYKTTDKCKTYKLIEISNTISDESQATDFFSKFGVKFRINMQEFGDNTTTIENNEAFESSFTNYTFVSRGSARRESRRK